MLWVAVLGWLCLVFSGTAMFLSVGFKAVAGRPGYAGHKEAAGRIGKTLEVLAIVLAYASAACLFVDYAKGEPWSWFVFILPFILGLFLIFVLRVFGADPGLLHVSPSQGAKRLLSRFVAYSRRNL